MNPDWITAEAVKDTLRAIRYQHTLRASPLLWLGAVTRRLAADRLADTPQTREAVLVRYVHDRASSALAACRAAFGAPAAGLRAGGNAWDQLQQDIRTGSLDVQALGLVYWQTFGQTSDSGSELAKGLGIHVRTLTRRQGRGYALLADVLREDELRWVDEGQREDDSFSGSAAESAFHSGKASRKAAAVPGARSLSDYRRERIAAWNAPEYQLDRRFVALTLLIDRGGGVAGDRWQPSGQVFDDLRLALTAVEAPAMVVLGPPGCGKSTLLRRLEMDLASQALLEPAERDCVTFLLSLSAFGDSADDIPPGEWLARQWSMRNPHLPELARYLAEGRMLILLDALNEMAVGGELDAWAKIEAWKVWLVDMVGRQPGNRVIFACRSLDYSQPLSSPKLPVPHVRVEPLSDDQVHAFLRAYIPQGAEAIWSDLATSPYLELLRSPFFLNLLALQASAGHRPLLGRAALFTGFLRAALKREMELGNPLFAADAVLTRRDRRRVIHAAWRDAWDLPERGPLVPRLTELAYRMQVLGGRAGQNQVRIGVDEAIGLLASLKAESIVAAGEALGLLTEDDAEEKLMFQHQLLQEYLAARVLAVAPEPALVRKAWRVGDVTDSLDQVVAGLEPADPLPPLATTGWEETTALAAVMTTDPVAFLTGVAEADLALAGAAAAQPELRERLPVECLDHLRWQLVERSRDSAADLRDRIACGLALGELGDPRLERRRGPDGAFLMPPLVTIPAGRYPIGEDAPIDWSVPGASGSSTFHMPRHTQSVAAFRIGRFAVTNAEWRCFIVGGGYAEDRWWDSVAGRAWRRGELANEGAKANNRQWWLEFRADRSLFERLVAEGRFTLPEAIERWRLWLDLDAPAFEAALSAQWQPTRKTEPRFWRDGRLNRPAQPVVGVCWYEARAYCRWLSAQSGRGVRLPSEIEWEAAARGFEARAYAFGDRFDRLRCNTLETHVRAPTPVGIFPGGDTPEGLGDITGNTFEWTTSAWGRRDEAPDFGYPYRAGDGREDAETDLAVHRIVRGGAWSNDAGNARCAYRDFSPADSGLDGLGFRIVSDLPLGQVPA
jgi:formylglycine-generating enzyme required for sulfatase activity